MCLLRSLTTSYSTKGRCCVFRSVCKLCCVAALTVLLLRVVSPAAGQTGGRCPACQTHSPEADEAGRKARAAAESTPHHGQVTPVPGGTIELVYLPKETRVYLRNAAGQPLSAAKVKGELNLQLLGKYEQVFHFQYPLAYQCAPAGAKEPDYLVAAVSQSKVKDGYMTVDVQLTGLPFREREAKFSQVFASSLPRTKVTVAALNGADRAAIGRQRVCPVSGLALDSMGGPIKVLVGDKGSLYLCCKNCLLTVEDKPEVYLAKAAKLRVTK